MQYRFYLSKTWRLVLACMLLSTLSLAACRPVQVERPAGTDSAAHNAIAAAENALPQVRIVARDFAFELPATMPAGPVSLTLANKGQVNHHAIVMRLAEGRTLADFRDALVTPETPDPTITDLNFLMPDTSPGTANQATVDLPPGNWVVFSASVGDFANPVPDWALGSIAEFQVKASEGSGQPPAADMVLTLTDSDVDMPSSVAAGRYTIEVVNAGSNPNGYAFFTRLDGGTTVEGLLAAMEALMNGTEPETMPQVTAVGGLMGHTLGESYFTTVDLAPGRYAVFTSIDDQGMPYTGMAKEFTVQ